MSEYDKYVGLYEQWPNIEAMRLDMLAKLVMKQVIRQEIPESDE